MLQYSTEPCDALQERLEQQVRTFRELSIGPRSLPVLFAAVSSLVHAMCVTLRELEDQGMSDEALAVLVAPAVEAMLASPFFARLRTWPRGYPGDFETVEYLVRGENQVPHDGFGRAVEYFLLSSMMANQHRFKVLAQADEITDVCERVDRPAILVIGCGSGLDLLRSKRVMGRSRARLVLNDLDPDALALCRDRVADAGLDPVLVPDNCFLGGTRLAALGAFDLIVAGGVFDYVPTRLLRRFLRRAAQQMLAPGGRLFATNIVAGHPYVSWMRHFGNWRLIERSRADLAGLADGLPMRLAIDADPTGLAHLMRFDVAAATTREASAAAAVAP